MANFGDFRPILEAILTLLKRIDRNTGCATCETNVTSAGGAVSIPAGFKSIAVIKTSSGGTATITLSDGSTYPLTELGESFADAATPNGTLPAYTIATGDGATWKWHGIK